MKPLSETVRRALGLVEDSFRAEQERNFRRVGIIRCVGVALILACAAYFGLAQGRPEWRVMLVPLACYLALAVAIRIPALRWSWASRPTGFAMALLDAPMIFWLQLVSLPSSASPAGVASFTLAIYCAFTAFAALSLDRWLCLGVAAVGLVLDLFLMRAAHQHAGVEVAAAVVLGGIAAGGWHLITRTRFLIAAAVHDGLKREKLERYFSPLVAAKLVALEGRSDVPECCEVTMLFADMGSGEQWNGKPW
jgi:adenylate cyclase